MITGFPLDVLNGSHAIATLIDVYVAGVKVAGQLPVRSGEITADRSNFVRRTLECEVLGDWPRSDGAPLNPYNTELQVWRGVASFGAAPVMVPAGRFRVDTISRDPNLKTTITVTGSSRESYLVDSRLITPRTIKGSAHSVVRDLVKWAAPGDDSVTITTTDRTVPTATIDEETTEAISAAAVAVAGDFYADPLGKYLLKPSPKLTDASRWTVGAGSGGVLVNAREALTREAIYNGVVARGESTTDNKPPVQYLATDNDPNSPTRWNGPFGQRPKFYVSPFITTAAQAKSAATKLMDDELGLGHTIEIEAIANPALEPGDVITVRFLDGSSQKHLVEALVIPLGVTASATLTTRATQVVLAA